MPPPTQGRGHGNAKKCDFGSRTLKQGFIRARNGKPVEMDSPYFQKGKLMARVSFSIPYYVFFSIPYKFLNPEWDSKIAGSLGLVWD